jgi:hypothetical protein
MPVESLPWSIQGQSHPATVARNATAAMLGAPAAAVSPAAQILTAGGSHGVVSAGDLAVTQNGTPNMSVNVAAGRAFIRGTETASLNQGVYSFFNDGTVNLTVAASDPTNPRRDLVVAQVRDSNYAGAANDARLFVVTGTPAASPSDPTIPANCLVLARISVAALSTTVLNAAITDLRTRASSLGGTQVCTSTTRPSGASLFNGLRIYETDTSRELLYDGTGWVIMSEPMQTYTPALTATVTNPALGSTGVISGSFKRRDGMCTWTARFEFGGAGIAAGSGDYQLSVPIAYIAINAILGAGWYYSSGVGNWRQVTLDAAPGSPRARIVYESGLVGAASPGAPAVGVVMQVTGTYQMTTRYS